MIILFYSFAVLLIFARLVFGPSFADRLLALDILSNIFVVGLVAYTVYSKSPMYLDIAIAVVMLSFIGVLAVSKWVKEK